MLGHAHCRSVSVRLPAFVSTLKFRIVAIVAATGMLSAWGTANLLLDATQDDLTQVLLANDRDDRERTAALLAGKLETLKVVLNRVAQQVPPSAWHSQSAMEAFLLGLPAFNGLFDSTFAARPDGTMVARIEHDLPGPRISVAGREYFERALRSDQPVVSEPLRGRLTHVPLVIVVVAVMAPDGTPRGVIAGSLRLQSTSLFAGTGATQRAERAQGSVDLVIDRRGVILSHPQPERLLASAAADPVLAPLLAEWLASGSPIETEGKALLSQQHLISMAGIPLSDWVHVRVTPQAVALQPLQTARRNALKAAGAAGALAALLSGMVAWLLVRPISRLRERAERMHAGETPQFDDWPDGAGELGAMARAFRELLQQRQRREAQMNDLLLQLEAVMDNAEVGIALTRNGRFEMVSHGLCRMLRAQRDRIVGQSTRVLYASDAAYEALSARARPAFMLYGVFEGEQPMVRRDGEPFWARMRGRAIVPGDRSRGTIWVLDDITQERQQRQELAWAANHDALTGLANRAAFERLLEQATARAAEQPFCALFIDLDRFKLVNDTGGHAAGDAMLRALAGELSSQLRKTDTLARLGGDEFAVLLVQCPPQRAHAIAETLRSTVEDYALAWEGATLQVGASIGLVSVSGTHASAADVLRAADAACYAAKREGRNRVAALAA